MYYVTVPNKVTCQLAFYLLKNKNKKAIFYSLLAFGKCSFGTHLYAYVVKPKSTQRVINNNLLLLIGQF